MQVARKFTVMLNAHCSVPFSFSFLKLGCAGFAVNLSNCSQNLILTSCGRAFNLFKTLWGRTISVAKVLFSLSDRLEHFHPSLFHLVKKEKGCAGPESEAESPEA